MQKILSKFNNRNNILKFKQMDKIRKFLTSQFHFEIKYNQTNKIISNSNNSILPNIILNNKFILSITSTTLLLKYISNSNQSYTSNHSNQFLIIVKRINSKCLSVNLKIDKLAQQTLCLLLNRRTLINISINRN